MPEAVSFFTPVSYGNLYTSKTEKLLAFADDCFFFGGHKAVVIERSSLERSQRVELKSVQASMWKTAFKIVAWLACFVGTVWNPIVWCVPAALIALKVVCHLKQPFHIETDPLQVPREIKICAPKDFRNLRNHEPSSDLSVVPYAENGVLAQVIPVHSYLLPDFFAARAGSNIGIGLDENEGKKKLDLRDQPFATKTNIDRLLDYYYGAGIQQNMSLDELPGLFQLADYVVATELKKEILQLLLYMPESREDVRLAPVFRNMFLSPHTDDEEFERLFEWYVECAYAAMKNAVGDESVKKLAEAGNVRAQIILAGDEVTGSRWISELAAKEVPLGQYMRSIQLQVTNKPEALRLLKAAADCECNTAIGALAFCYLEGNLGLTKDVNQTRQFAEKAAAKDSLYAISCIGALSCGSVAVELRDAPKAFEQLKRAANMGFRQAQMYLGNCFEYGIGTARDRAKALDFYTKAKVSYQKRGNVSTDRRIEIAIQRVRN